MSSQKYKRSEKSKNLNVTVPKEFPFDGGVEIKNIVAVKFGHIFSLALRASQETLLNRVEQDIEENGGVLTQEILEEIREDFLGEEKNAIAEYNFFSKQLIPRSLFTFKDAINKLIKFTLSNGQAKNREDD
jgi:hypothetical protein